MNHHSLSHLRAAGLSDVGCKRASNEDNFCIDEALGLLLVADGMGGHAAGEIASQEAVTSLSAFLRQYRSTMEMPASEVAIAHEDPYHTQPITSETMVFAAQEGDWEDHDRTLEDLPNPAIVAITAAIQYANQRIYAMNQEMGYRDKQGMGTTVVGLWLPGEGLNQAAIFHTGDSRLYLYRAGQLLRLTKDHTLYQQWEDYGRIGPSPARNTLLRALGPSAQVTADVCLHALLSGDLILLCSDGLTSMVPDPMIEAILAQHESDESLESTCKELIDRAKQHGGDDNVTVILCRYV